MLTVEVHSRINYGGKRLDKNEKSQAYYRIPKFLFDDEYKNILSTDAKMLYALLLDRASLSAQNGWFAEDGRVFIYFTVAEAMSKLCFGKNKIIRLFDELEKTDLIERAKTGLGKASIIYFSKEVSKQDFCRFQNQTSGSLKNKPQEVSKPNRNNTENNNNNYNNNNLSLTDDGYDEIRSRVEEQLDYDFICSVRNKAMADELVTVICDVLYSKAEKVRVGGELMSKSVVEARLMKLDCDYICYVIDCLNDNTTSVKNIRSYMLTALYNAPATCSHYYTAKVNHDLYGGCSDESK